MSLDSQIRWGKTWSKIMSIVCSDVTIWRYDDGGPTVLIKAGGVARRSRQILRSEEVDHQAALLGRMKMIRMMMRMMMRVRKRRGRMEIKMRIRIGMRRSIRVRIRVGLPEEKDKV